MSTPAAFFLGEGEDARFLGGVYCDGYIKEPHSTGGVPLALLRSTTEEEFRRRVNNHLKGVRTDDQVESPFPWVVAKRMQRIYCFFEGHVWVTNGGRWYNPCVPKGTKPSKTTPSAPVCRIGTIEFEATAKCGQCLQQESLAYEEFKERYSAANWSANDIVRFFESKGWQQSEAQGWLCSECKL
jgi:hypothetical protein